LRRFIINTEPQTVSAARIYAGGAVLREKSLLRGHYPTLLAEVHREEGSGNIETPLSSYNLTSMHRPDLPPFPAHFPGILAKTAISGSVPGER
jgi:hypothetical protein